MLFSSWETIAARVPADLHASVRKLWDTEERSLFFPEASDAYVAKLEDNKKALALLYLLNYDTKPLIPHGLLEKLATRVTDEDLYARAHAVEVLLRITTDDSWFDAAPREDNHERLLGLGDDFVEGLLANRVSSYPGGELACLKLLAFWLSWVRHQHTEHRRLPLSRRLLSELSEWAKSKDKDQATLAAQLFDDFSRCPPHDGPGLVGDHAFFRAEVLAVDAAGAFDLSSSDLGKETPPPPPPLRAKKNTPPPPPPPPHIKTAHERGNKAFAEGDFERAIREYDVALREETGADRATLYCNRATCLHNLGRDCEDDCRRALEVDPSNAKANYRLAQCLREKGEVRQLWEAVDAATKALEVVSTNNAQRAPVEKLLVDLMERVAPITSGTKPRRRRKAQLVNQLMHQNSDHEMLVVVGKGSVPPPVPMPPPEPSQPEQSQVDSDDDEVHLLAAKTNKPRDLLLLPLVEANQTAKKTIKRKKKKKIVDVNRILELTMAAAAAA